MKTAVEILVQDLEKLGIHLFDEVQEAVDKALEMEKEQIIDAFWNGDNTNCIAEQNAKEFAEKYYNETFKQ